MKDERTLCSHTTPRWPKVLGLAALSLTLLTPAMAGGTRRHSGHHGKHHVSFSRHHAQYGNHFYDRHRLRGHGPVRGHRTFVVPGYLTRTALATYRDYHHGRIYYGPHRHHHTVYNFPVYTNAGWVSRPHYYCNGSLYRGHESRHDRHFRLSVHF